jgi:transcriptional regulator with XRE-family HTH domain
MVGRKAQGTDAFVKRLNQACDDVPDIIPPHGEGRQIELAKRMGMSQEGVRKWFAGEAMPRRGVMEKLATVLRVEESWLALGMTPEITRDEKRVRARNVEGAALLAMGAITLAGGACAIPDEEDPRRSFVDFYSIHNGVQSAIHVGYAKLVAPGSYEVTIPREYKQVRIIVVVPLGNTRFDFIVLDSAVTPTFYQRKGGAYVLSFGKSGDGTYVRGDMTWKRVRNFGELA